MLPKKLKTVQGQIKTIDVGRHKGRQVTGQRRHTYVGKMITAACGGGGSWLVRVRVWFQVPSPNPTVNTHQYHSIANMNLIFL